MSALVKQITDANQNTAFSLTEMGFKLDRPAELMVYFSTNTQEKASMLAKNLKSLGFAKNQISSSHLDWKITSEIKMPISTFISRHFVEQLADAILSNKCKFQGWQKKYIL
ncbi:MAG: ribonuclease E inhibitor RraB [Cyanobacteria bacterium P01_G01_bin.49]